MYSWQELDRESQTILNGFGGENFIAVRPSMVRALRGNGNAAIMLTQMIFWSKHHGGNDGWFWKTVDDVWRQTGLGKDAQQSVRKLLVMLNIVEEETRGMPPVVHFRLNYSRLCEILVEASGEGPIRRVMPSQRQEGTTRPNIRNKLEDTRDVVLEAKEIEIRKNKLVSSFCELYPIKVTDKVAEKLLCFSLHPDQWDDFSRAVVNYRHYVDDEGIDPKYIFLPENFIRWGKWEPWVDRTRVERKLQKQVASSSGGKNWAGF